jgi:hypothetical protein
MKKYVAVLAQGAGEEDPPGTIRARPHGNRRDRRIIDETADFVRTQEQTTSVTKKSGCYTKKGLKKMMVQRLVFFAVVLVSGPTQNGVAELQHHVLSTGNCDVEPVSRKCCGPNATRSGYWCGCKEGRGCGLKPNCDILKACANLVGFHINGPRLCLKPSDAVQSGKQEWVDKDYPLSPAQLEPTSDSKQCFGAERTIRFIHIDKAGGTTIRAWFKELYPEPEYAQRLVYPDQLGHHFGLGEGCTGECYVFFVRDPIKRWVSRFEMRKEMLALQPARYNNTNWAKFLQRFPTPNDLAEGFTDADPATVSAARKAFVSSDLGPTGRLAERYLPTLADGVDRARTSASLASIAFIGGISTLQQDFERFCKLVGLPFRSTSSLKALNSLNYLEEKAHLKPSEMHDNIKGRLVLSAVSIRNIEKELAHEYRVLNRLHHAGLIVPECTSSSNCNL